MRWSDIQFRPPRKTLREFAGLWLIFFGGFALWQGLARGRTGAAYILAAVALTVAALGFIRPEAIRLLYVGWMVLAFPIGWLVSQVLVVVLYFGVFTPIAFVFRLVGRDALHRTRRPDAESYWVPKPMSADVRSYFRQF